MVSVHDVAAYILSEAGSMPAMKLQKLVYYSQAWSLVWDEKPLFQARIEAWANGPVIPFLYQKHRKEFILSKWPWGNPDNLNSDERETIDAVLKAYANKSSQWLSDLTHIEAPWRDARQGIPDGERGSEVITHATLAEYYGSL